MIDFQSIAFLKRYVNETIINNDGLKGEPGKSARCYNENGQIHKNQKVIDYYAVLEELRLGCYRSNVGGTGRFAKGIMNDCKVYNYAISDELMNELLLSTNTLDI